MSTIDEKSPRQIFDEIFSSFYEISSKDIDFSNDEVIILSYLYI